MNNSSIPETGPELSKTDMACLAGAILYRGMETKPLLFLKEKTESVGEALLQEALQHDPYQISYPDMAIDPGKVLHLLAKQMMPQMLLRPQEMRVLTDGSIIQTEAEYYAGNTKLSQPVVQQLLKCVEAVPVLMDTEENDPSLYEKTGGLEYDIDNERIRYGNHFFEMVPNYIVKKREATLRMASNDESVKKNFLQNVASLFGDLFKKKDRGLRHDM